MALPRLHDRLDPVADEAWLVADELLADLAAPLHEGMLVVRDRLPELA